MTKLTNVIALTMVLGMQEVQANQELVVKLETMKAQFEKKSNSNGEKKLTATQVANQELSVQLLELITEEPQAQSELQKMVGIETSQKMTAVVKILGDKIVKSKEKGKTMLALNTGE